MNETTKKIAIIAVIVVALIAAGFGAKKVVAGDQPQFQGSTVVKPGTRSMKDIEMEQQNKDRSGANNQGAHDKSLDLGG